jgi:hypothetical protein
MRINLVRRSTARLVAIAVATMLALTACSALPARSGGGDDDDSGGSLVEFELSGPAARYLAIAEPANAKLDDAFDELEDNDSDLAEARADFALAAQTERSFDRDLLAIAWPAPIKATARALVNVNEARVAITEQAAAATSLADVAKFKQDIDVANDVLEVQVELIRQQLGLPPPDTS